MFSTLFYVKIINSCKNNQTMHRWVKCEALQRDSKLLLGCFDFFSTSILLCI
jgi:hypothetical protein